MLRTTGLTRGQKVQSFPQKTGVAHACHRPKWRQAGGLGITR